MGLVCAAYEVEIEAGGQDREGSITPVRDCTNLATELLVYGGTYTRLCAPCHDLIVASPAVHVASVQKPRNN
jgi:hypothetical protein